MIITNPTIMEENIFSASVLSTVNEHMVSIPAGEIELRDDRIRQKWTVKVRSFLLAKYPVTQDVYFDITQASPSTFKGGSKPVESVSWQE